MGRPRLRYEDDQHDTPFDRERISRWYRESVPLLGRGRLVLAVAMVMIMGLSVLDWTPRWEGMAYQSAGYPQASTYRAAAYAPQVTGQNPSDPSTRTTYPTSSSPSQHATNLQDRAILPDDRLATVGRNLLRSLQPAHTHGISFSVDRATSDPRSSSTEQGDIVVSEAMLTALQRDSFLATVLAYEVGRVISLRSRGSDLDLHDFAVNLLVRSGYDPQVIPHMAEWILAQTSVGVDAPQERDLNYFKLRVNDVMANRFPSGLPTSLMR